MGYPEFPLIRTLMLAMESSVEIQLIKSCGKPMCWRTSRRNYHMTSRRLLPDQLSKADTTVALHEAALPFIARPEIILNKSAIYECALVGVDHGAKPRSEVISKHFGEQLAHQVNQGDQPITFQGCCLG
jgi:hypothetical protein